MFVSATQSKSVVARLLAGAAAVSLLATTFAAPASAQDAYVITNDELVLEEERLDNRRFRERQHLAGGEYIRTPNGDYVLIEDRRFRKGLRAGHRARGDGFYGQRPRHQAQAPVRIAPPKRRSNEAVIAAGIVGLAAGAIIANELGRNRARQHGVHVTRPPAYQPPVPVRRIERVPLSQLQQQQRQVSHSAQSDGWIGSREWLAHCTRKYRSFNPGTGQFLSYSGQYKLCR